MKFFKTGFDGGAKSGVVGFWVVEIKSLFSIVVLKFNKGTREAFHSHAFNAFSWIIKGSFKEHKLDQESRIYTPNLIPKYTPRSNCHKVEALTTTWVLSIRGPWQNTWKEYWPRTKEWVTFQSGRKIINKKVEENNNG